MKFKYLEKVRVKSGFYTGQEGICLHYKKGKYQIEIGRVVQEKNYYATQYPAQYQNVRRTEQIVLKESELVKA